MKTKGWMINQFCTVQVRPLDEFRSLISIFVYEIAVMV